MKVERRRSLIIFGDVTGSRIWERRSTPEDVVALMEPIYAEFLALRREEDLFVKILGDGFMAIRYLSPQNDHRIVKSVFRIVMASAERIERLIRHAEYPRPQGFRIRAVIGPVWALQFGHNLSEQDVIDYHVGLCNTLLGLAKPIRFIVGDSVRDLFARHRDASLRFTPFDVIEPSDAKISGTKIDPEDLKLWVVQMPSQKRRSHDYRNA